MARNRWVCVALLLAGALLSSSCSWPKWTRGLSGESPEALIAKLSPDGSKNPAAVDAVERREAVNALRKVGAKADGRLKGHIIQVLELVSETDEDPAVRMAAMTALTDLAGPVAGEKLTQILQKDETSVCRDCAARCLGGLRLPETVPQLHTAYKAELDPFIRGAIVKAAAKMLPDAKAKALVEEALSDPDASVSLTARDCLRSR